MYSYILCIGICAVIWTVNGIWLRQAVRKCITSEIYIHTGLGIFFSLLALELTLGTFKLWARLDIFWLEVIGLALYIPSAYLVAASMHALKHKGRPKTADPTATTTFIDTGVYGFCSPAYDFGNGNLVHCFHASFSVNSRSSFRYVVAILLLDISQKRGRIQYQEIWR